MFASAFSTALGNILGTLLVLAALAIYVTLIRQISMRESPVAPMPATDIPPPVRTFEWPEALLAGLLTAYFCLGIAWSVTHPVRELDNHALTEGALFTLFVVFLIAALLKLRGIDIEGLAGFSKTSVKRAVSTGIVLLLAAAPLIAVAEVLTQAFSGGESSKQEIIVLFNSSRTIQERVTIIVLAVVVAPLCEEFIFRFFIYGVLRRYFGVAIALILNALLFAAAHAHLPSAAPLFVLGACFTLAYEWSGSILVSMAMHSLFNSAQLIVLAFPELVQQ